MKPHLTLCAACPGIFRLFSKKDKLSLVISLVSLILSLVSLALTRMDAAQARTERLATANYQAYRLGDGLGQMLFAYKWTTKGDPVEIQQFRVDLASYTKQVVQPIADRLDLRIDATALLSAYELEDNAFSERVLGDMGKHIIAAHGAAVADKFKLAHHTFALFAYSKIVAKSYPEDEDKFYEMYKSAAKEINPELAKLQIQNRLSVEKVSLTKASEELLGVRKAVEQKLVDERG